MTDIDPDDVRAKLEAATMAGASNENLYVASHGVDALRADAVALAQAWLDGLGRIKALEAEAETGRMRDLLHRLVDTDPCDLDHTRFCQAHGCGAPCVHAEAKVALEIP